MHSYIISSYFFRFHPRKTSDLVELHCRILSQLASFVNTYGEFSKYFPLLYSIALFQSSTEYEEAITSCCIREHNATCFQQVGADRTFVIYMADVCSPPVAFYFLITHSVLSFLIQLSFPNLNELVVRIFRRSLEKDGKLLLCDMV